MWVIFTVHQDKSSKVRQTVRFCSSHTHAVIVSKAYLKKNNDFDFVSWDFCQFNLLSDYSELTEGNILQAVNANPCSYSRQHDIGLNGLYLFS